MVKLCWSTYWVKLQKRLLRKDDVKYVMLFVFWLNPCQARSVTGVLLESWLGSYHFQIPETGICLRYTKALTHKLCKVVTTSGIIPTCLLPLKDCCFLCLPKFPGGRLQTVYHWWIFLYKPENDVRYLPLMTELKSNVNVLVLHCRVCLRLSYFSLLWWCNVWGSVLSTYPHLCEGILFNLFIIIKRYISIISQRLWLAHETMACVVCLAMFLLLKVSCYMIIYII